MSPAAEGGQQTGTALLPLAGSERATDLPPVAALPDSTERDVSRTDRTNKFYEGPENPGLGLLNDILLTYCMYHFDLGERRAEGRRAGLSAGCSRCGR